MEEKTIREVNILKGRLAEALVQLLFTENGYEVHRSGMEHILPLYARREKNRQDDLESWVRRMPDFLVVKDGNSYFIEVKYVTRFSSDFHDQFLHYPDYPKLFVVTVTPEGIDCRRLEDLQNGLRFDNVYLKFLEALEDLQEEAKAEGMEREVSDAGVEEAFSRYKTEVKVTGNVSRHPTDVIAKASIRTSAMLGVPNTLGDTFGPAFMVFGIAARERRRGVWYALAIGITVVSLTGGPAWAWEADVHYGLTKWLAIQTGYLEQQAEWIARGNQGLDDSWVTSPILGTILASCSGDDAAGSVTVHNNHFPSRSDPPDSPAKRTVVAGSSWQDGKLRQPPRLDGSKATFMALGRYLHALQDSWSHQGEPDVPQFCKPDLGWGHAVKRGGWSCHLADLTYRWQATDVPRMARATYDVLSTAQKNKSRKRWEMLERKIEAFAGARTKWKKDEWFKNEDFPDRRFLQVISLPDYEPGAQSCTPYPYQELLERWKQITANGKRAVTDIPKDVASLFEKFFWGLTQQAVATLQYELVDEALAELALARALHVNGSCPQLYRILFPFLLGNGFAEGRGAHQPLALCEMAIQLRQTGSNGISCTDAVAVATKTIAGAATRGPGLKELADQIKPTPPFTYSVSQSPTSKSYFALVRFIHLPRDVLFVGAEPVKDRLKVTSFIWLPNE